MRSLQKNFNDPQEGWELYDTMFVWNEFLTRGIRDILKTTLWTVALVYGFFKQVHMKLVSFYPVISFNRICEI
jgi:phosphatidylinositol 3,5-bisphosphate 5-phosphatase